LKLPDRSDPQRKWIIAEGTQIVVLRDVRNTDGGVAHPRGAVGTVVESPSEGSHSYRVQFLDGIVESLLPREITMLTKYQGGSLQDSVAILDSSEWYDRVLFQCIIGSQAYGLADDASDIDRRGFFLPSADAHWSLSGVPEQIECDETQEAYWELQKFIVLALKANPNVLECLYSPLVEKLTPLAQELIESREMFLSKLVFQTYNGYVASQFKKMESDIRNKGSVKWKHAMHLIRLLISGIEVLKHAYVPVDVGSHRDTLLAIKRGELDWKEIDALRLSFHQDFSTAFAHTRLPERPDYHRADAFLIRARRAALEPGLP
jgi:predicted nucleotidyltransferase